MVILIYFFFLSISDHSQHNLACFHLIQPYTHLNSSFPLFCNSCLFSSVKFLSFAFSCFPSCVSQLWALAGLWSKLKMSGYTTIKEIFSIWKKISEFMHKILKVLETILRLLSKILKTLNLLIYLKIQDTITFVSSNFVLNSYPICSNFHMYSHSGKRGLFRPVWRPKHYLFGCY